MKCNQEGRLPTRAITDSICLDAFFIKDVIMMDVDLNLIKLKKLHEKLLKNNFRAMMTESNEKITFCYEARCGDVFHKVDDAYNMKWINIDVNNCKNMPNNTQIEIGICMMRDFNHKNVPIPLMNGVISFTVLVDNSKLKEFDDLDSLLVIGRKLLNAAIVAES